MVDNDGGMPNFAELLDHLFKTVPGPGGKGHWSNEQAAAELARLGTPMSGAYLSQLRHGKRLNPSARSVGALATLFAVPVTYFYEIETAEKINKDLRLLSAIRDSNVESLALRARGLSPKAIDNLKGIIDHIRELERLPEEEDPADAVEQEPSSGPD